MCGIVGIVSTEPVNQQIYDSLLLLQHRGQDSTGIATADGPVFHMAKARGQVREAFRTRDMRSLLGNIGLGHVRYTTKGAAEREEEAQPFYVNAPYGIILVHNGNLTNTRELSGDLFPIDRRHVNSTSDTEMLLNVLATELQGQITRPRARPRPGVPRRRAVHERVEGSYAVISLIAGYGLLAFRDPYGIRPLILGKRVDRVRQGRVDRGIRVARARERRLRDRARRRSRRGDLHHLDGEMISSSARRTRDSCRARSSTSTSPVPTP